VWLRVAIMAFAGGSMIGWAVANVPLESLTWGDWMRSLGWTALALATPVAAAAAVAQGRGLPTLERMLGRAPRRPRDALTLVLGVIVIVLTVLTVQAALGLVFNPRYRDFPFAPLTAAVVPLVFLVTWEARLRAARPAAETAIAATLIVSAIYIACNESFANWQSLWFCAGVLAFALTLLQARAVPD
jgi:glucan 1,3-beta-glucosidase